MLGLSLTTADGGAYAMDRLVAGSDTVGDAGTLPLWSTQALSNGSTLVKIGTDYELELAADSRAFTLANTAAGTLTTMSDNAVLTYQGQTLGQVWGTVSFQLYDGTFLTSTMQPRPAPVVEPTPALRAEAVAEVQAVDAPVAEAPVAAMGDSSPFPAPAPAPSPDPVPAPAPDTVPEPTRQPDIPAPTPDSIPAPQPDPLPSPVPETPAPDPSPDVPPPSEPPMIPDAEAIPSANMLQNAAGASHSAIPVGPVGGVPEKEKSSNIVLEPILEASPISAPDSEAAATPPPLPVAPPPPPAVQVQSLTISGRDSGLTITGGDAGLADARLVRSGDGYDLDEAVTDGLVLVEGANGWLQEGTTLLADQAYFDQTLPGGSFALGMEGWSGREYGRFYSRIIWSMALFNMNSTLTFTRTNMAQEMQKQHDNLRHTELRSSIEQAIIREQIARQAALRACDRANDRTLR